MKDGKEFKLIDGVFTAKMMRFLTALINYKIDYHNREDFSNHIRFNKDPEHSSKLHNSMNQNDLDLFFNLVRNQNLQQN
jgi:hypothetical protein